MSAVSEIDSVSDENVILPFRERSRSSTRASVRRGAQRDFGSIYIEIEHRLEARRNVGIKFDDYTEQRQLVFQQHLTDIKSLWRLERQNCLEKASKTERQNQDCAVKQQRKTKSQTQKSPSREGFNGAMTTPMNQHGEGEDVSEHVVEVVDGETRVLSLEHSPQDALPNDQPPVIIDLCSQPETQIDEEAEEYDFYGRRYERPKTPEEQAIEDALQKSLLKAEQKYKKRNQKAKMSLEMDLKAFLNHLLAQEEQILKEKGVILWERGAPRSFHERELKSNFPMFRSFRTHF